ncbi:sensor domain-containing phosphodiesterase [Kineococcus xinjiangensis]|nr:EAL domain-containing protein [Kineococcus xinjiangensis]
MGRTADGLERARLEALHRYAILDTPPEPVFDDLAAIAASITGCPTALIGFVDADRQWFKSVLGFPFTQSHRSISFCDHTIRQPDVLVVEDATADDRFAANPLVTAEPRVRFYAGAPLVTPDGQRLGTICGIDYAPKVLDADSRKALARLAQQVVRELEMRRQLADLTATVTTHRRADAPEMLQAILDGSPAIVSVKDPEGRFLLINRAWQERFGFSREEALDHDDEDLFGPEAARKHRGDDLEVLGSDRIQHVQEHLPPGRTDRTYQTSRFALRNRFGEPYAVCAMAHDVTDRVHAEEAARRNSDRAEQVMAGALDGVVTFSADGAVTGLNPAAEQVFATTAEEARGREVAGQLLAPIFREDFRHALAAHLQGAAADLVGKRVELLGRRGDGEPFPVEMTVVDVRDDPGRFVAFVRDVSERRHAEERLRHLAEHDPHTGLANRATFLHLLATQADAGSVGHERGSLLLLDLDSFKHINDTFGHRAGDDCLRHVAEVLCDRVRDGDVLARLGGDEFALLLPGAGTATARAVAESLLQLLRARPLVVDGRPIRVTASVGVAPVTAGVEPEELLHAADAAMYEAKQLGRDRVAVFSDVAVAARTSALHVSSAQHLRDALAEERFTLYAQPIHDITTGRVAFQELLIRMEDDDGALVPPAAFLPAAERFDLIQKIDCWVVSQAARLLRRRTTDGSVPQLHVNLSGRSLSDLAVLECIERQLQDVDASRIVFEITETSAVTHLDMAVAFTQRLAALGCGLSLDDFGAGYASFYYLKHLPVQSVKIDGEFVQGILTDRLDRAVVRATVSLAADMGYRTIAEYVESAALLEELHDYGVDYVQGYHIGRPVAAVEGLHLVV